MILNVFILREKLIVQNLHDFFKKQTPFSKKISSLQVAVVVESWSLLYLWIRREGISSKCVQGYFPDPYQA